MDRTHQKACVILAAGQGTRMKSPLPKVLHPVGGRSMLDLAIDAAQSLNCARIIVVVGAHSPQVGERARARLGEASVVIQDPPLGTAHAVLAARDALKDFDGVVLVSYADCPLMSEAVLSPVLERAESADLVVLGFDAADPSAYGRLILGDGDDLLAIIEAKEASPDELKVRSCNSGVLACDRALLFSLLADVDNKNAKGEYYLTDIVGLAKARSLSPKVVMGREEDTLGVNSQFERAVAEKLWQEQKRAALLASGVMMIAPETVFFSYDTVIEQGVTLEPHVIIGPKVVVKSGAVIRAFSHLEGCVVGEGALIGPYARLRPGAVIGASAHIGNFVEVKNVEVGEGAKANHLSYLGDGTIGAGTNIGAGTIFCNYDGYFKSTTTIGKDVFIGSQTALVAPVTVGDGAMTASGSVITETVPEGALAFGRAKQVNKEGYAASFRRDKAAQKAKIAEGAKVGANK